MIGQLVSQHAQSEFDANDDAGVVSTLNAQSIDVVDEELYTWAGVALYAGPEAAEGFRIALDANGMGWAIHQLGGSGLQISNPMVKGAVEQFVAGGLPLQPLLDQVFQTASPAQQSLGRDATLQDVADYRLQLQKQTLEDAAVDALQTFREALSAWDGTGTAPVLGA